jgi:hypothetical protein
MLSLNDSVGRVEFVRHLYNLLCIEVDQDQDRDTDSAVRELNKKIKSLPMKSMYTKQATAGKTGRKRAHTGNGDRAGGAGEDDRAQLRAHGYEVKPEVIVDASGGEWAPLYEVPATLFYYIFAMLTLDPRGRTIFSLCTDPWTRTRN